MGTGNYCAILNNMKLVHWPLMGGLLCLVQRWGDWAGPGPPRPLIAVPNVTAHPSTASVPITVLLYNGPLLCGFNVPIKGLTCLQARPCLVAQIPCSSVLKTRRVSSYKLSVIVRWKTCQNFSLATIMHDICCNNMRYCRSWSTKLLLQLLRKRLHRLFTLGPAECTASGSTVWQDRNQVRQVTFA